MRRLLIVLVLSILSVQMLLAEDLLQKGQPSFDGDEKVMTTLPHFEVLARVLSPSVVNISVETAVEEEEKGALPPGFPFYKNEPGQSLGSGFILSEDGYIATNYHVVEKAEKIIVRLLDDRKEYEAVLIGRDDKTDLALLKIASDKKLTPVFVGDSDTLQVGEWVLAIGNQFQLGQTVTAGIISAKSRKVRAKSIGPYDDFIQTDASINPGSSGGPLFNSRGQVIGINTAIFSPGRNQFGGTGFNIGIGFAIPINMAESILKQIKESGKVTRGLLGVIIQNIDSEMALALGLDEARGALVAEVVPGSPAAVAGFRQGDIILNYDNQSVDDHDDLPLMVATTELNAKVPVVIVRGEKKKVLHPVIAELSDDVFVSAKLDERNEEPNILGVVVEELNDVLARSLKVGKVRGLVVTSVESGSPAETAKLAVGDIILAINRMRVRSKKDLEAILAKVVPGKPALMLVKTRVKGQLASRYLTFTLHEK